MNVRHDPVADALFVYLRPGAQRDHSTIIDDERVIDYDAEGRPIGVEFLAVSHGVDLDGLPEREAIAALLAKELPELRLSAA